MARMYTLDHKLLTDVPEVRVGDMVIKVDDREKTVKKVLKLLDKNDEMSDGEMVDGVFKLALEPKDHKKISDMNMPWAAYQKLFFLVISALTGEEPEKIEERFPKHPEQTK